MREVGTLFVVIDCDMSRLELRDEHGATRPAARRARHPSASASGGNMTGCVRGRPPFAGLSSPTDAPTPAFGGVPLASPLHPAAGDRRCARRRRLLPHL